MEIVAAGMKGVALRAGRPRPAPPGLPGAHEPRLLGVGHTRPVQRRRPRHRERPGAREPRRSRWRSGSSRSCSAALDGFLYAFHASGAAVDGFPVRLADPAKVTIDPATGFATRKPGSNAQSRLREGALVPRHRRPRRRRTAGDRDREQRGVRPGRPGLRRGLHAVPAAARRLDPARHRPRRLLHRHLEPRLRRAQRREPACGWTVPSRLAGAGAAAAAGPPADGRHRHAGLAGDRRHRRQRQEGDRDLQRRRPGGPARQGRAARARQRQRQAARARHRLPERRLPERAGHRRQRRRAVLRPSASGAFGDLTGDGKPEFVGADGRRTRAPRRRGARRPGVRRSLDRGLEPDAPARCSRPSRARWTTCSSSRARASPTSTATVAPKCSRAAAATWHAFGSDGAEPAGWPKFTHGWMIPAPTAGDVDGDGLIEVVASSREGFLYVWDTPALSNDAAIPWQGFGRDRRNTKNLGSGVLPTATTADPFAGLLWALEAIDADLRTRSTRRRASSPLKQVSGASLRFTITALQQDVVPTAAAMMRFVDFYLTYPSAARFALADLRDRFARALQHTAQRGLAQVQCAPGDTVCAQEPRQGEGAGGPRRSGLRPGLREHRRAALGPCAAGDRQVLDPDRGWRSPADGIPRRPPTLGPP
ncbi:MAG: hypothetical protein M0C28_18250 [Candidatus Moduliflexus flocculans]|nr:hypothetical protein [Candidatus Moduliflexus flocculans]